MTQPLLFEDVTPTGISVDDIAKELNVSSASVRNWIKTGYLTPIARSMVSYTSFTHFRDEVAGTEKLNKRANKSQLDQHDHKAISAFVKEAIDTGYVGAGDDTLADLYEQSLSSSYRNQEGIFYTPPAIVATFLSGYRINEMTSSFVILVAAVVISLLQLQKPASNPKIFTAMIQTKPLSRLPATVFTNKPDTIQKTYITPISWNCRRPTTIVTISTM